MQSKKKRNLSKNRKKQKEEKKAKQIMGKKEKQLKFVNDINQLLFSITLIFIIPHA